MPRALGWAALPALVLCAAALCRADPLHRWQLPARAPGPYFPLGQERLAPGRSFAAGQPIVGTYFFYWYDAPTGTHVYYPDGGDQLTDHPPTLEGFSYKLLSWHRTELEDMIAAGVDFLLPVFWGVPGFYRTWCFEGLRALVQAHDELVAEGKTPPQIGLFYDTSTLRFNPLGAHIDLSTDKGKDWFYGTIRDFFSMIPPRKWAMIEGKPIVVIYTANFAKKQDRRLLDEVRARFRQDFGTEPYLIKSPDFLGRADAVYSWGAALRPVVFDKVCAIGPGYDHSAVRGRAPLVREREGGRYYQRAWENMLQRNPKTRPAILLIETWNEFHEGTDICRSREYGTQYIELTRKYADLWHKRARLPCPGEYAEASVVSFRIGARPEFCGLSVPLDAEDGPVVRAFARGAKCLRSTRRANGLGGYIYFQVDNSFLFDEAGVPVVIAIEYLDRGTGEFFLEYDSADREGSVRSGAFKRGGAAKRNNTGAWQTAWFFLADARFADRCNGNDFRLCVGGQGLELRAALVARARKKR